ncbi:zinc finger MYM-type protein 1-like [Aquarana catesbeiana]|uniref:zinc finger MYM-type protein 1-like n=1 Tax=Aquarana catesbeiana TaxID=8400 RepID=UPI003CC9790A
METEKRFRCGKTIDASVQKQILLEKQRWHEILERLIATVQFLSSHNLPFRGHRDNLEEENSGNFIDLIKLCARFDPVLRQHLQRFEEKRIHNHYLGKNIQNELISLMAKLVKQKVIEKILQAKYYSIIIDCTRDVSHVEQMTVVLRHVDEKSGDVEEHFIGFLPVDKMTAEELTKTILLEIEESGLDIKNCRGQGYDNGANMRGEKSGVKTRILNINPLAFFTPCGCHSWNLVLGDAAASCAKAKLFFGVLQRLYTLFSGSSNRWAILKEKVNITLKPLSETRWECRVESVKAVRYQLKEIAECLEEMAQKNADPAFCSECNSLKEEILSYEFVLSLIVWYEILVKINLISKVWQKSCMQLDTAVKHLEAFLCWLKEYRQNGHSNSAIATAREIAEEMDIPREFRQFRIRRTKRMFDYECPDEAVVNPVDRFRAEYFNVIADKIHASAEPRFEGLKSYVSNFGFLYDISSLCMKSKKDLLQNCKELEALLTLPNSSDSDIRGLELYEELRMCMRTVPPKLDMSGSLKYLIDNNLTDVYPNIYVALRVILTIPVTVASAERSFSKLKLIKTYLRSTMSQERLSALAVLSIERDLASKLNYSSVIDEFTTAKCRRMF